MSKCLVVINTTVLVLFLMLQVASADTYIGDTAIYSTISATAPKPNVMFIIDNTQPMQQQSSRKPYDGTTVYPGTGSAETPAPYDRNAVYQMVAATGGTINYSKVMDNVADITCGTAHDSLIDNGSFFGPLKANKGDCSSSQNDSFFLGNQLNYIATPPEGVGSWTASTVYSTGDAVDVDGTIYEVVGITGSGLSGTTQPTWPATLGVTVTDGEVTWRMTPDLLSMVKSTVKQVADAASESANIGLMTFSDNGKGGQLEIAIANVTKHTDPNDPDAIDTTRLDAFNDAVDALSLIPGNSTQPVNEILWDAGLYFKGSSDFTDTHERLGTIEAGDSSYTSLIEESCQKNFVVLLTTGSQDDDTNIKSRDINNNVDKDPDDPADPDGIYVDDVAKYLNSPDLTGADGIGDLVNGLISNNQACRRILSS